MALPNSNISTTLVGQTLGTSSRDVGTLCTHPNINKWSKWKPVRLNKVTGLVSQDLSDINFGILPVVPMFDWELALSLNWEYGRPRGGDNNPSEPFRLGDFRNYEHAASDPVSIPSSISHNLLLNNTLRIRANVIESGVLEHQIGIHNLPTSISLYYLAVILKVGDSDYYIKSSQNRMDSGTGGNIDIVIQTPLNSVGTGEMFFVVVDRVISYRLVSNIEEGTLFLPIPGDVSARTLILDEYLPVDITVTKISNTYNSSYEDIENYEGTQPPWFLSNDGNIYFEINVYNPNEEDFIQRSSNFKMTIGRSFSGNPNVTDTCYVYDESFNRIILNTTIASGATRTFYIGVPGIMFVGWFPEDPIPNQITRLTSVSLEYYNSQVYYLDNLNVRRQVLQ